MSTYRTVHEKKADSPRSFHPIRGYVSKASSVHSRDDSESHCFDVLDLLGTSDKNVHRLLYLYGGLDQCME
jgi:hypothetical protein